MSKRQLIIEKSVELFAKKGFESTSIQEITQYCGISKGAFYLSFKSKEELVVSIIEYFMTQLSNNIDQVVRSNDRPDHKLYYLYLTIFQFLQKHHNFALIFAMEQVQCVKKEMFESITAFDQQLTFHILNILEQQYEDTIHEIKYDLVVCIKGFFKIYSELLFTKSMLPELSILCYSLVDKTNVLAKHATVPFLTEELYLNSPTQFPFTLSLQQILDKINQLLQDSEHADSLELESLAILKNQLEGEQKNQAILRGMINNLKHYPRCKVLIHHLEYLLENKN